MVEPFNIMRYMKPTAKIITKSIRHMFKHHEIFIPNFYYGWCECDVFSVTNSSYSHEFEIKIDKNDLKKDFTKTAIVDHKKVNKHEAIKNGLRTNYFSFVVTEELLDFDFPDYCGVFLYVPGRCYLKKIKSPKLLHKNKFNDYRHIARRMCEREFNRSLKDVSPIE